MISLAPTDLKLGFGLMVSWQTLRWIMLDNVMVMIPFRHTTDDTTTHRVPKGTSRISSEQPKQISNKTVRGRRFENKNENLDLKHIQ